MKQISFFIYFTFFFQILLQSQTLDATLLELKFSNDGYPEKFTKVDNGFFFSSEDDQLWFSDGSVENTYLVKDFESGLYNDITSITAVGSKVFFVAQIGRDNRELWVSDGTEEGTIQLTDRNVSFGTESIHQIIAYHGKVYFGAYSETYGNELWVSDGTSNGTFVLKDITESGNSNPRGFFIFNDNLIFQAVVQGSTYGYWTSDGTETGTVLLKDIQEENSFGGLTEGQVIYNGNFYFFANNGETGNELWKSNGTTEGTQLVKDIYPGKYNHSSYRMNAAVLNNKLLFIANDGVNGNELWSTDGTSEGTTIFKDFNSGAGDGFQYNATLQVVGDKVFFTAYDGAEQTGLWVSDGTDIGTTFLNPSWPQIIGANETGTVAYFFAYSAEKEKSIFWKSDGTPNGTSIISEDVEFASSSLLEQGFLAYGDRVFFNGTNKKNGKELFVTDGTTEGTKLFYDVNHSYGAGPSLLTAVGNQLFFRASKDDTFGLYTSDGTIEGTKGLNIGSNEGGINDESEFIDFNGKLIVSATDGVHGYELWISDGTQEGTFMVKDINPGNASSMINSNGFRSFVVSNNKLYFYADDGSGLGLWVSDGTSIGTYKLSKPDVKVLIGYNGSSFFTVLGGDFYYFGTSNEITGIYKVDASTNESIFIHSFVQIEHMYVVNNKLFIIQDNGEQYSPKPARELWVVDGTTNETSYLLNFADDRIDHVSIFKNEFYFTARIKGSADKALYKSDGSVEGTIPVFINRNLPVTTYPASKNLIACGEYIYFGIESSSGYINELWRTDGTPEGTIPIVNGEEAVFNLISDLSCVKDNLIFKQHNSDYNFWTTNGEPNSLEGVNFNITNGSPVQSNFYFTPVADKMFFSGTTPESGSEIYVTYPENILSINDDLISKTKDDLKVVMYPNPSKGKLNIKISNNNLIDNFEVFNMSGKKIITKKYKEFKNEIDVNVAMLSPGIYVLKLAVVGKGEVTTKLIVNYN